MNPPQTENEHPVTIACDDVDLEGLLHIPDDIRGIVIFAHGSGSSRFSVRNQAVAQVLQEAKFATLLFDLLTAEEEKIDERTSEFRFDIKLLAKRLVAATHFILANPTLYKLPLGYFGASTGGGAALLAAAKEPSIKAVVSRGGRPDLAGHALPKVQAATLLIVGGDDEPVIELNEKALAKLPSIKKLVVVPHASHLFEEPGKLAEVATLARAWFEQYLRH